MMIQANQNVASFNIIIEILQNDQSKIKLIRKYENTRKKIINNECAILFNKTCIYIYIYIYIYIPKQQKGLLFNLMTELVMNFKNFIEYLKVQIYFPKLVFANMWPEAMAKKLFISIKVSYEF